MQARALKNRERTSVEATIANQSEAPLARRTSIGFEDHMRRLRGGQLNQCENIAQRSQGFLRIDRRPADHLGVETNARELDEILLVCDRQIEGERFSIFDDFPSRREIALRDGDFLGEHIDRAERQNSHLRGRPRDTVDDLVDRSISAGGDDDIEAIRHPFLGKAAGVARFGGELQIGLRSEFANPFAESRGFVAAGSRIEDDESLIHTSLSQRNP